jgi:YbgC/YbaW family acyl-CoA thioester hydrolase
MFKTSVTIEWGDCDEAGIVFYPNYFYWLDCAFQRLLRARGLSQRELRRRFGAVTPIVQAHCDFKAPARYDDVLEIDVTIAPDGERRFRAAYHFSSNGKTIGTGHEVRAWARVDADGNVASAPVNAEFIALLTASR